jgi:hypothetical protein
MQVAQDAFERTFIIAAIAAYYPAAHPAVC